jgi:hypothetical protein
LSAFPNLKGSDLCHRFKGVTEMSRREAQQAQVARVNAAVGFLMKSYLPEGSTFAGLVLDTRDAKPALSAVDSRGRRYSLEDRVSFLREEEGIYSFAATLSDGTVALSAEAVPGAEGSPLLPVRVVGFRSMSMKPAPAIAA